MPGFIGPLTKKQSIAKLAKKVNKNTRALQQREMGRIRVTVDSTPDTTAVVQNLAPIAQGDDIGARTGRQIIAKSISIRGVMFKAATSAATTVRMIIFRDNLGSTTPPTLADLFIDESDFFSNQHRRDSEQNMRRFTILWDKYIILNEGFDGQTTAASFKYSKKLNFKMIYTGTAATDEGKNSLWLMSGSNEASLVPAVVGDTIFKYIDP